MRMTDGKMLPQSPDMGAHGALLSLAGNFVTRSARLSPRTRVLVTPNSDCTARHSALIKMTHNGRDNDAVQND